MQNNILKLKELVTINHAKVLARNISLEYQANKITYIQGKNGSGKTTLLNQLYKQYQSTANIYYLPQNDLKRIPISISLEEITEGKTHLLNTSQLQQSWNQSSGGEKKRALTACLLAELPDKDSIILCDEPFNHLDQESIIFLSQILINLKNQHWIILVSHQLNDYLTPHLVSANIKWI